MLNLDTSDQSAGEYAGYSPMEHLAVLNEYAPSLKFDLVVVDSTTAGQEELKSHLSTLGSEFLSADLRSSASALHHDVKKLASLFTHIDSEILVG